jgi:hypothetical protein
LKIASGFFTEAPPNLNTLLNFHKLNTKANIFYYNL